MIPPKIAVHTDVLLAHLTTMRSPSVLRVAMRKSFCYTTVFQAIELFAWARTAEEIHAVENSMASMRLLGLSPKNARVYGELLVSRRKTSEWNVLIAGLCIESKLPLLTDKKKDFAGMKGLQIVSPKLFMSEKI